MLGSKCSLGSYRRIVPDFEVVSFKKENGSVTETTSEYFAPKLPEIVDLLKKMLSGKKPALADQKEKERAAKVTYRVFVLQLL